MIPFKTKPYAHQQEAYDTYKDRQIAAFNADMGVGKTKVAIDINDYRYVTGKIDRVVIIAPNGVHEQWLDEQYPLHCSTAYKSFTIMSNRSLGYVRQQDAFMWESRTMVGLRVIAINIDSFKGNNGYDTCIEFLDTTKVGVCIIVDEASTIKSPDIITTKNVKKLARKYPKSYRITMTGTPAAKGPVNMWSIFDFLREGYMNCSYIAFKMTHTVTFGKKLRIKDRLTTIQQDMTREIFDKVKRDINLCKGQESTDGYLVETIRRKHGLSLSNFWQIHNAEQFQKYKNLDRLYDKIAPDTWMISKKDCLDLPDKVYKKVYLKLSTKQKDLIHQLEKYAVATYHGEELTMELKAQLGLRVLQICGGFFAHHTDIEGEFGTTPVTGPNAKLNYIKDMMDEIGEQQSIIWAVYTDEVDLIYNTLLKDHSVGRLDGTVIGDNRGQVIKDFKSGKIQHLVAHPTVGAFGYNFQCATVHIHYSRDYRTEKRIQCEDRSYRIGTVVSPVYIDLMYGIYWEEQVFNVVKDEAALNNLFISANAKDLFRCKR